MASITNSLGLMLSLLLHGMTLSMEEPEKYILDFPSQDNPLNIPIARPFYKNYFMIIADWGAHSETDRAVQRAIANKMLSLHRKRQQEGYNLLFIVTAGDNFYFAGLDDSCDFYVKRWINIYHELATDYPWLVVKGNHDWVCLYIYIYHIYCILVNIHCIT